MKQAEAAVASAEQDLRLAVIPAVTEQDLQAQQAQVDQLGYVVQQAQFELQKAQRRKEEGHGIGKGGDGRGEQLN